MDGGREGGREGGTGGGGGGDEGGRGGDERKREGGREGGREGRRERTSEGGRERASERASEGAREGRTARLEACKCPETLLRLLHAIMAIIPPDGRARACNGHKMPLQSSGCCGCCVIREVERAERVCVLPLLPPSPPTFSHSTLKHKITRVQAFTRTVTLKSARVREREGERESLCLNFCFHLNFVATPTISVSI